MPNRPPLKVLKSSIFLCNKLFSYFKIMTHICFFKLLIRKLHLRGCPPIFGCRRCRKILFDCIFQMLLQVFYKEFLKFSDFRFDINYFNNMSIWYRKFSIVLFKILRIISLSLYVNCSSQDHKVCTELILFFFLKTICGSNNNLANLYVTVCNLQTSF